MYLILCCEIWPALRLETDTVLCKFLLLCLICLSIYVRRRAVCQSELHKYFWQLVWMNSEVPEETEQDSAAHISLSAGVFSVHPCIRRRHTP